ncbi:hypothetical protein SGRIM128S_04602 [Streptomyces griseomycini]
MTTQPLRTERSGPQTASVVTDLPFKPQLVKAVFRDVTSLHVSRPAAWAAASVTRTVLTEIIDGARSAAAEEARKRLIPKDLISAIDRNVEVEVGSEWYLHSPTFHGLMGELRERRWSARLFVSAAGHVHRVVWLAPTGSRPG